MMKQLKGLSKRRVLVTTTSALVIGALFMLALAVGLSERLVHKAEPESSTTEPVVLTPDNPGAVNDVPLLVTQRAPSDNVDGDTTDQSNGDDATANTNGDELVSQDCSDSQNTGDQSNNGGQDNQGGSDDQNNGDTPDDGCDPDSPQEGISYDHDVQCGDLNVWGVGHLHESSASAEAGFSYTGDCLQAGAEAGFCYEDGTLDAYAEAGLDSGCLDAALHAGLHCEDGNVSSYAEGAISYTSDCVEASAEGGIYYEDGNLCSYLDADLDTEGVDAHLDAGLSIAGGNCDVYVCSDSTLDLGCITISSESSLNWGCNQNGWYCEWSYTSTITWGNSTSQLTWDWTC